MKIERLKISKGYHQVGHGRGFKKSPCIYLINNRLYAKDKQAFDFSFEKLDGNFIGYIPINVILYNDKLNSYFYAVSSLSEHKELSKDNIDLIMFQKGLK